MGKKKKDKKKSTRKQYPTSGVEERAKEAMKLEPPDENEHKKDNELYIEKFLRYRPRVRGFQGTIKEKARKENN